MVPAYIFNPYDFMFDIISSLVIVISCFIIYAKTRELYDLSSYKGIKYFRNTFLFFGITYFIRFLLHILRELRHSLLFGPAFGVFEIAFFVMVYSSSMALLYLLYSLFWKKLDREPLNKGYFPHVIALILAIVSMFERIAFFFLAAQVILFGVLLIASAANYRKLRKKGGVAKIYLIYPMIFGLLVLSNILEFVTLFSPIVGVIIYIASIPLFLVMMTKVLGELNNR